MTHTITIDQCAELQDLWQRALAFFQSMLHPIDDEENEGYFDGTSEFFEADDDDDDDDADRYEDDDESSDSEKLAAVDDDEDDLG